MRYSLVIYLNAEYFEIKGYSKIPGFEHIKEDKLKGIVEFTNNFEDEEELILYLIEEGIIPSKYSKGNLAINFYKGKNTPAKTLQYGISFKNDKRFFDTIFLKYYFRSKLTNLKFMNAFINKYYTYLKDIEIFGETLRYINYSYEQYKNYGKLPNYAEEYMTKFIEIYCSKKGKDGFYKADFTKIRDLAMFAINYERNNEQTQIKQNKIIIQELEIMISHYQELIKNDTLTAEELNAYSIALNKLEFELEDIKTQNRRRRTNNEPTTN